MFLLLRLKRIDFYDPLISFYTSFFSSQLIFQPRYSIGKNPENKWEFWCRNVFLHVGFSKKNWRCRRRMDEKLAFIWAFFFNVVSISDIFWFAPLDLDILSNGKIGVWIFRNICAIESILWLISENQFPKEWRDWWSCSKFFPKYFNRIRFQYRMHVTMESFNFDRFYKTVAFMVAFLTCKTFKLPWGVCE